MKYFLDAIRAMLVTLKNFFRPVETVRFPFEKRERGERYRSSFALIHDEHGEEACIACKLCERICPSEIITVVGGEKKLSEATGKKRQYVGDFTLDLNACIYCELCVQVCPVDAIVMCRVPEVPGFFREDLVLTMDKLYANEAAANEPTWANATKLWEMQDPKRGLVEPEPEPAPEPTASENPSTEPAT